MAKEKGAVNTRREERRRRRIRNQILAYMVLVIILAGLGMGGYFGIKFLLSQRTTPNQPIVTSDNTIATSENSTGVIATPEDITDIESQTPEPVEEVDPMEAAVAAYISSMTIEQKVANLFIVSPESITGVTTATRAGDGTRAALSEYAVGGIIYAGKNITGADQFKEMVSTTQSMYQELYNLPLWIVAQDEGATNVLGGSHAGVPAQEAASEIGSSGDSGNAYQAYVNIGTYLQEYGINVNLGPVCDVASVEGSFLGNRSFNSDADIVSSMIRSAVDGQMEQGIVTCLTAFPGQGSSTNNPTNGNASIASSLDEMRALEFLPFAAGIEEGAQLVMMSNMTAENATGESVPCSMSTSMVGILRDELGFEGVIISAPMNQKTITNNYTPGEAAVNALSAGVDMILLPNNFAEAYAGVLAAIADGTLTEEQIDASLTRILLIKMNA